jgi:hypothetical protein
MGAYWTSYRGRSRRCRHYVERQQALAAALREAGGVPDLKYLREAFVRSIVSGDAEAWDTAVRASSTHPHTQLAARAGDALLEQADYSAMPDSPAAARQRYYREVADRLVRHFAERTRPGFIPTTNDEHLRLMRFPHDCRRCVDVDHFARQLERDPSGGSIRAPRRSRPPLGTGQMLNRPVGKVD